MPAFLIFAETLCLPPVRLLLSFVIFVLPLKLSAQSDGFAPYDKHRMGSMLHYRHELLGSINYTLDYEFEGTTGGNLHNGMNYGIGLGYAFRLMANDHVQAISLGAKAEWYPGTYFKCNSIIDLDLLGAKLGSGAWEKGSWFFLSGLENQVTFKQGVDDYDFYAIIYLAELNYLNYELKWGLQTTWESFKPTAYLDDTFTVLKFTYRLGL